MEWTEERVAELTELWNAGHSAAQVASRMGEVTRNAVIGKVHRLGLSGRPSPIKRRPEPEPEPPRKRPALVSAMVKRPCQWPFGNPGEPDFYFCGQESAPEKPYCPEHVARAYHMPEEKRQVGKKDKAA
ncbi:MAG: GcrA family cell cycle regulator [Alphaproteobacteria bacterium]